MDISFERIGKTIVDELKRMTGQGCSFADARFYDEDSDQYLTLYDGNLEANAAGKERGIGIRVRCSNPLIILDFGESCHGTARLDLACIKWRSIQCPPGRPKGTARPRGGQRTE